MQKVICDKCKAEFIGEEILSKIQGKDLCYVYSNKAWQKHRFDLCDKCRNSLDEKLKHTEANFINPVENPIGVETEYKKFLTELNYFVHNPYICGGKAQGADVQYSNGYNDCLADLKKILDSRGE